MFCFELQKVVTVTKKRQAWIVLVIVFIFSSLLHVVKPST